MAENEGNAGEFENFQITSLKSILLRIILIPFNLSIGRSEVYPLR